ncbi:MAG: hypothetical protein R3C12_17885 [Planctomycetaceae bacterium]|nr:hypothetical protein [Planctomycetaceae bacterium]
MTHLPAEAECHALAILRGYEPFLEWTAPERTIHQCREFYFQQEGQGSLADFTAGLRFLLENRLLKRLTDERLELTDAGRAWHAARARHHEDS